jgi:hypothetical protein
MQPSLCKTGCIASDACSSAGNNEGIEMKRRATKKMLRRAEQAFREELYDEAERIYGDLLKRFEYAPPSLLDYAACILGLIRIFYVTSRDEEAVALADSAQRELSRERELVEVAA